MRIAFFDATPKWSGGATRILFLAQNLKLTSTAEPFIVCLPESDLCKKAKENGLNTFALKPLSDVGFVSFFKILEFLKKNSIDIVDVNSPKFYWLALYASKILGIKTILTRNVPYRKSGIKKIINKFLLYKKYDAVISLSENVKKQMVHDYDLNNITVIYDGILSGVEINEEKRRTFRKRFGFTEQDIVCATVGRLEKNKGQLIAVIAISEAVKKFPALKLLIIGDGDKNYKSELVNFISKNNLDKTIKITGFIDDISMAYSGIDILIHPSFYDNIPFSILEAMNCGILVIATKVGGIPEVIEDGKNGYLVPSGDSQKLAEKIIEVLDTNYRIIGENGRPTIREKFSKENMFSNYCVLLKMLTSKGDGSGL